MDVPGHHSRRVTPDLADEHDQTDRPCPAPALRSPRRIAIALAVLLINTVILVHFHDRFWWPPDEGNYAHVAERLLDGEVLHAEIQDIHPGYVNFVNAGALGVFGRRLVSMRYPLVLLGVIQAAIIYALLLRFGTLEAVTGSTTLTALGFIQFLNPTAHWYALFLAILLAAVLQWSRPGTWWRVDAVGVIVVTALLFRQLSGVFIAMAAVTVLLLEARAETIREAETHRPWLARVLVAVMMLGLTAYLLRATEWGGALLFGASPLLVLAWTAWRTQASNEDTLRMCMRLLRGSALAALPLAVYHVAHGSFGAWYHDAVVVAVAFPGMLFFDAMRYRDLIASSFNSSISAGMVGAVNGVFWIVLTVAAAVLGGLLLARLRNLWLVSSSRPPVLAIVAIFYALVSVHYQIPIYLTYTAGLSIVAIISVVPGSRLILAASLALAVTGLRYHAGAPLSRSLDGRREGQPLVLAGAPSLPRAGLRVEPSDVGRYEALVALIHREVPRGAAIFAVPSNAELYFLSERRNPFSFFNTALGVQNDAELASVLAAFEHDPPVLVFHDRDDKYNTRESRAIMDHVAASYDALPPLGGFEIFRHRGMIPPAAAAGRTKE